MPFLFNFGQFLCAALIVVFLTVCPVAAEMRVFELQHRPASELAENVTELLGEQARVAAHRNTLVVRASPEVIADVETLVATFDKPLSMLRISVEQGHEVQSGRGALSASGAVRKGPVAIGTFSRPGPEDGAVFTSTGDAHVELRGQSFEQSQSRHARQFISVVDGGSASISVGRAVPFTSQLRYYSRRHPHYVESVSYQRVDTGFRVIPQLNGNDVDVEIAPYMAFLDQDDPLQIIFHDAATKVRIPAGAWYDLSQYLETHDDLSREILSVGADNMSQSGSIRIRIDPQ